MLSFPSNLASFNDPIYVVPATWRLVYWNL